MHLRFWLCALGFATAPAFGETALDLPAPARKPIAPPLPAKVELTLTDPAAEDALGLPGLSLIDPLSEGLEQLAPPPPGVPAAPGDVAFSLPFSPATALSESALTVPVKDSSELMIHATELPPDAPIAPSSGTFDLLEMAVKHGPAILVVKSWDKFGSELGSSMGFFVSADGRFLADGNLISPERAKEVDYFTAIGADGETYVVKGMHGTDPGRNLLYLQADATDVPFLPLAEPADFTVPRPAVIAGRLQETDVSMSEVAIVGERSIANRERWWQITGQTASASPGSPILTKDGKVLGIVTMFVPGETWVNYAVSSEVARALIASVKPGQKPVHAKRIVRAGNVFVSDEAFADAFEAFSAGSFERAAHLARRLVTRSPRNGDAWGFLGLCLARNGNAAEALPCFEKAVNLQPENPALWSQLALLYGRSGNPVAALDSLTRVVSTNPSDSIAWLFLGEVRLRRGETDEAFAAFERAVGMLPDSPHAYFMYAFTAGKRGDLARAEGAALQCARLDPDAARSWYLLGLIYRQGQRLEKAAKAFQETLKRNPDHPKAWLNYAHALKATGDPAAAKKAFQKHLELLTARETTAKTRAATQKENPARR